MAAQIRPDAVFLDIGMPDLNGYEAAAAVRPRRGARGEPSYRTDGLGRGRRRANPAAGFDHHITKPASLDSPMTLVAEIAAKTCATLNCP